MAKILDINEMLEASRRLGLRGHNKLEKGIVEAAERLRQAIAKKLKIPEGRTSSEELELHGVCGSFMAEDESLWPVELSDLDEGGELGA